ncbi:MAG TPA: hypothetical protein VJ990_04570 [Clostridia bacterium]|nr:hypothetical protein [Clostridia bacterium]
MSVRYSPKVKKVSTSYLRSHDKDSTKTLRESSRENFLHEKKEMEKELSTNIETICKLLNDRYRYVETQTVRGRNVMIFRNEENKIKKIRFEYEKNYHRAEEKLKEKENEWEA